MNAPIRNLVLVLGDQLDLRSAALDGFDPAKDAVLMLEVAHESTKVWSTKPRIAVFIAAMRHFAKALRARGWRVFYRELRDTDVHWPGVDAPPTVAGETFAEQLCAALRRWKPARLVLVEPGEYDVWREIENAAVGMEVEFREDRHFLCTLAEFQRHASSRKQLRMEFFYREMRQKTGVLMEQGKPIGGAWNFDHDNRESFGSEGPGLLPAPRRFQPDALTREVLAMVDTRFAKHAGDLAKFDWPVTAEEARLALEDFLQHRLPDFGRWQDAMWAGEPWLYHSRLSAAMNLKLLDPREVIAGAEAIYRKSRLSGDARLRLLASVEGFIRQILGWREYVRGIYWQFMPGYRERNALGADMVLPGFYWDGETDMACLRDALKQTLTLGYAHHIQRLMVTGLYALLLGVRPREIHEWYLAVYVDAVEWVELPNTLGMSQFADGGVMASKPYVATGKYIERMSNHCAGCRYHPAQRIGEKACPFTTLYWDFLLRHEGSLTKNPRMVMQVRNLSRITEAERAAIQRQAAEIRSGNMDSLAQVVEREVKRC